jgi:hypothetical protein
VADVVTYHIGEPEYVNFRRNLVRRHGVWCNYLRGIEQMKQASTFELLMQFEKSLAVPKQYYNGENYTERTKIEFLLDRYSDVPPSLTYKLIQYLDPQLDGKMLSVFINANDAERNRRTVGKPAKILRKICAKIPETDLEAFSVWVKDMSLANDGLVIKTCTKPETFADVYKRDQATRSDPRLGAERKSLAASCMRYEFSHLPHHPAYIYGSGDFTIAWVENSQGQLAARVVVCTRTNKEGLTCFVDGPIYTNSNVAADMLEQWIDEQKQVATDQEKHTWVNAKLLRIETPHGLLAPYLDRDSSVKDNGDFLVVSRFGEIELSNTQGTVNDYEYFCECCGQGLDEYDTHWAQDTIYCGECHSERFTHCSNCEEYELNEHVHEVQGQNMCICDSCLTYDDDFIQMPDGGAYHIDDCIHIEDTGEYYLISEEGKTWFTSDIDDEPYDIEDQAKLPLWYPDVMTRDQAIETGHWTLTTIRETVWHGPRTRNFGLTNGLGYYVTKVIETWTLKPWLEWNGYEIENNQLDLFESEFFTI